MQEKSASVERQYPRYAHTVAVTIHVGKRSTTGRTTNVSRGGLCADVEAEIKAGTEVEVDIVLVFDDEMQSEALRLPARVAWCTTVDEAFQLGLSFKPLDAERAKYLQLFLKYLGDERAAKMPRSSSLDVDKRFG
ncbi:MAG TPA: PilZ domain-containing protein [Kofleriaceae bacterium]|nr:PilZ domain-containing protein [Kofleriaceae bacterium]